MSDPDRSERSVPRESRRRAPPPALASEDRHLALSAKASPRALAASTDAAASSVPREVSAPVVMDEPGLAFFEDSPDAILRFDRAGVVVYANPALQRATALPRSAFLGRRLDQVSGFESYAPLWAAALEELFASEESRWFKFSVAHPMGAKQFDVRLNVERDLALRVVTHAHAVWRDVTVPRHLMRVSRKTGDFVDTMLSSVRLGVCMLDRDLRVRAWNRYLEETLRIPAERVFGRRPDEIPELVAVPDGVANFERMKAGKLVGTQVMEYPFALDQADPTRTVWLRVKGTPVTDARGAFDGVFVEVERIDRERFAEASLAALRHALDSAGEMVLEIDRKGAIVDANDTARAWLGYPREQLRGMRLENVDANLNTDRFGDILTQLTQSGSHQGESVYCTQQGGHFPVDVVFQRVEHGSREFIFLLVRDITDRKRIEAQLAEVAQRFRLIFEESPVAKLVLDANFRVVQANAAAARLLGRDAAQLPGMDPHDLLTPGGEPVLARLRQEVARGAHTAVQPEHLLIRGDGASLWCRLALSAWRYSTRQTADKPSEHQYLMVLEDLTERRHADEQLQSVLRDQQTLLETMTVGVVQAVQGRVTLANREFARMFGFAEADVIGMSLWDLAQDRDQRMPNQVTGLPAVRPNQTTSAEVVLFRADGEPIWCLVQGRPIASAMASDMASAMTSSTTEPTHTGGVGHAQTHAQIYPQTHAQSVMQAIYTFQDVSEMKRQREALSRSLLELNVVLDTTAVAVLHLSGHDIVDGQVIRCNAQAYLMFGGTGQDIVGRRFASLLPLESDAQRYREAMRGPLQAGELYSFETQLRGRAGAPFWALVSLRAVDPRAAAGVGARANAAANAAGSAAGLGLIASILDISDRRAQEEQLQALLAESQLLFETALVGLLFVRDQNLVRANAAMEELLACEPGGLTDQGQLFTHPTDQLLMANLSERFVQINAHGMVEFEMPLYRRRGDPIWVAVQGRAVNAQRPELGYVFAFVDIDERKRTERELRATLGELQLIFDNTLVGMMYVANGLIVKANAATQRMLGYDQRDFSELSIDLVFAESGDWRTLSDAVALACESGDDIERSRGISFERLARRADGTAFWCAGNVRPLDPAQPAQGLIIALMDVDARHRSEDELRRVRNYLDLVVEHLPVLVSVREATSGRFVSLNRAGESITGLAREQVIGRTWHEVYGRQFADLYVELDRKALAAGAQVERPRDVMLRADGRRLTVNHRIVPLFEPQFEGDASAQGGSAARYVMSIIDDLTEEVRAETLLAETETRFRQFAENIDQLVFIATADLSAVLYVNPRYSALVGGDVQALFENPREVLKHVHLQDAPRLLRLIPRLVGRMRRLRKCELTVRVDHPQRGVRTLHVRLSPVRMAGDGTVRVFGIADDVTERVAAEQQRIEDAVRQRDILVREVHHRIKNNLQGVAGLLQHMASSKPELAVYLDEIASQIQAIAQVHGLQIRATGTLPILGVVQGIFGSLSTMFGVDIQFESPPPALWRWGLPEQEAVPLALIINELGTNAIKYRSSREAPISVQLAPRPQGIALTIENPGQLKEGFDLAHISASVSGLGLIKALLPRRGARLNIEQHGARVLTHLELAPPAIGEDVEEPAPGHAA